MDELKLTETDRSYEKAKPGYYHFDPWVYEGRKCLRCGTTYETRLELAKFCSRECQMKWLETLTRAAGTVNKTETVNKEEAEKRGGFTRADYMREYMRKKRAEEKAKETK